MSSTQSTESRGAWLFRKLAGIFGARFVDMWRDVDPVEAHATWTLATRELSREALQRGISACFTMRRVPTLPEFLEACRPAPAVYTPNHAALTDERRTSPAEARAQLAKVRAVAEQALKDTTPPMGGGIRWAYRLLERAAGGHYVTPGQIGQAKQAIEAWQLTHGRIERSREPGSDDEDIVADATRSTEEQE